MLVAREIDRGRAAAQAPARRAQALARGSDGMMPKVGLPDQAVYLDSPVLSAVRQIQPFFTSGAFGISDTPLIIRHKPLVRLQRMLTPLPRELDIRWIRGRATQLPVASGGVVFYPFNARSNLQTVTRRDLHHVLTLHGESNKAASMRPAARLYDYVCIAGPLARDRYLQAGIFTPDDVDRGRLVMMGDTFVQPMPEIRPARAQDADPVLFYAPTWEGFGGAQDNHSSICGLRGFEAVVQGAKCSGIGRVVIRPHPYLGLLRPQILRHFLAGVRLLRGAGLRVAVWLQEASLPLRLACLRALGSGVDFVQGARGIEAEPVALGLCDVSGMEAIFLKQRISHMVLTRAAAVPSNLAGLYQHKALLPDSDVAQMMARYLDMAEEVDAAHCAQVFDWTEPSLAGGAATGARGWLINYVRQDPFWQRGAAELRSLGEAQKAAAQPR